VILRARVDEKGCGTAVAVVVHSGVEAFDAAALQWFETAQFSPKWVAGKPAAGELTFNLKFILEDRSVRSNGAAGS
jgi:TonB family protein